MSQMLKRFFHLAFLMLLMVGTVLGQSFPDFSKINLDELSDQQIQNMLQRATSLGYSQQDIFQLAQQQGLSLGEISKLGQRIDELKSSRAARGSEVPKERGLRQNLDSIGLSSSDNVNRKSEVFGVAFFKNGNGKRGFEPNLNIPTPQGYRLGAGDELFIDLYGSSEQYYQATINSDGNLLLENIGPIFLSGLTIENAEKRIKSRLTRQYTGLGGESPTTFLSVTLGDIKSIDVSVVGEVTMPGNYTLSGFSNVFNALYAVGGVTENGTLREIKVLRNNKLVASLDAYEFLIKGNNDSNIRLQTNDVIVVGTYTNRVEIAGAVKRPAIYELKPEESLQDLIGYAGGFAENAFQSQIGVIRNLEKEKVVADVFQSQFEVFSPKAGDLYEVKEVLDRFTNRVQVQGAVFRQGSYAIEDGLTVKKLIQKAAGVKGDANLSRASIIRSKEDLSTELITFNLGDVLAGRVGDITLQREDILKVNSINNLTEESYVQISGEVNNGGVFTFSDNMTVEDLIINAGGFRTSASESKIEITRRFGDAENGSVAEVVVVNVDKDLGLSGEDRQLILKPFDHVLVRKNPNFFLPRFVGVEGQVKYPGEYAIKNQTDRVSSLVQRAGGLNQFAHVEGATLLRKTEFSSEQTDLERRVDDLESLLKRYQADDMTLSEAQLLQLQSISQELSNHDASNSENKNLSSFAKRERLREIVQRNTLYGDVKLKDSEAIGIDLKRILENPGSREDLMLEEGDVLVIPKKRETVRLRGRVLYPTTIVYEKGLRLKQFINQAGGFDSRAKRPGTYVIYANGKVARTKRFLFFKSYPKVEPGAEIIVPVKPPKIPVGISEVVGITSGLATLALLISQINFN